MSQIVCPLEQQRSPHLDGDGALAEAPLLNASVDVPEAGVDVAVHVKLGQSVSDLHYTAFLTLRSSRNVVIIPSSISFITRRYSRIRLEDAPPGPYHLLLEALADLRNLTISVSIVTAESDIP